MHRAVVRDVLLAVVDPPVTPNAFLHTLLLLSPAPSQLLPRSKQLLGRRRGLFDEGIVVFRSKLVCHTIAVPVVLDPS
jgi:hypothetical protein